MACFFPLYVPRHKRVHTRLTPRSFHSPSPSPAMWAALRIQHLLQSRNLPRWRCAYRGYVGRVARIRRWRRHPGFPPPGATSPGNIPRWRCAYRGYMEGSPDKALAPPSRVPATGGHRGPKISPVALRLPGLRGNGSPDKAQAPPSGVPATGGTRWQWKYFPRAALISPGGAALTGATWGG